MGAALHLDDLALHLGLAERDGRLLDLLVLEEDPFLARPQPLALDDVAARGERIGVVAHALAQLDPEQLAVAVLIPGIVEDVLGRHDIGVDAELLRPRLGTRHNAGGRRHVVVDHDGDAAADRIGGGRHAHHLADRESGQRRALPEGAHDLRRLALVAADIGLEQVFLDQLNHFLGVVEAEGALEALLELLVALLVVAEDVRVEPVAAAAIGVLEELPVLDEPVIGWMPAIVEGAQLILNVIRHAWALMSCGPAL